jgi:hypothetical protein
MTLAEAYGELFQCQSYMQTSPRHTVAYEHAQRRLEMIRGLIRQLERRPVVGDGEWFYYAECDMEGWYVVAEQYEGGVVAQSGVSRTVCGDRLAPELVVALAQEAQADAVLATCGL